MRKSLLVIRFIWVDLCWLTEMFHFGRNTRLIPTWGLTWPGVASGVYTSPMRKREGREVCQSCSLRQLQPQHPPGGTAIHLHFPATFNVLVNGVHGLLFW